MAFYIKDNIIKTEDIDFNFEELGGLGNVLFNSMKSHEQKPAQIDPYAEREDTYEDLLRFCIRTAIAIRERGIKKEDIIMVCCDNSMDPFIPFLAGIFIGAIPCAMDPYITPLEMKHIVGQVKPKIIFSIPRAVEAVSDICKELALDNEIVVFGPTDKYTPFEIFIRKQSGEEAFQPIICKDPRETAVVYFSSGTSGLAKACCLSHRHVFSHSSLMHSQTVPEELDVARRDYEVERYKYGGVFLMHCPLYWISGGTLLFSCTFLGLTRLLGKQFDVAQFWNMVEKYRVSVAHLLPVYLSELVKHGPPNVDTDSLVKIYTGGADLQVPHWQFLQDVIPETDVLQYYGLTETGTLTMYGNFNKRHRDYYKKNPKCLGFPCKGVWYKVVDLETKEPLGPNQEGELLVKSDYFMNGFYNQPNDDLVDEDGWFRTGDVVYYTDNCAFYITDRFKDLMRYKQLTVYPCVIEEVLLQHPAVEKAVALALPHVDDGDWPAAFVILKDKYEHVTAEEIRKFVDDKMLDKAKLRGGLKIVDSFPMTSTGKVKKRELKKMLLEGRV